MGRVKRSTSSISVRARVVACLAVLMGGALVAATAEPLTVAAAASALLLVAALVALELGLAAGTLMGIAGAAGSLQLSRILGTWEPSAYVPLLLLTAAFILVALSAAAVRAALIALDTMSGSGPGAPANGSLGLLPAALAEARLDEEIDRAAYARSPLTVIWIRTRLFEVGLPQPDRGRVLRVASRTIESVLEVVQLPVAFSDADIVCILAETDEAAAERLIERIRRSSASATLLVGPERSRRRFSELATVDVGVASYPAAGRSGAALIEAAHAAIRPTRDAYEGPPASAASPESRALPRTAEHASPGVPVMAAVGDETLVSR